MSPGSIFYRKGVDPEKIRGESVPKSVPESVPESVKIRRKSVEESVPESVAGSWTLVAGGRRRAVDGAWRAAAGGGRRAASGWWRWAVADGLWVAGGLLVEGVGYCVLSLGGWWLVGWRGVSGERCGWVCWRGSRWGVWVGRTHCNFDIVLIR